MRCFGRQNMNDYKELISTLRTHAEYCDMPFSWMNDAYNDAADAIEHLVKERDEWKTLGSLANKRAEDYREMRRQRDKAIKERDAAIEDIACLANDPNVPAESLCKKFTNHGCCCYNYYTGEQVRDCTGFEWRGVREVEHEAD